MCEHTFDEPSTLRKNCWPFLPVTAEEAEVMVKPTEPSMVTVAPLSTSVPRHAVSISSGRLGGGFVRRGFQRGICAVRLGGVCDLIIDAREKPKSRKETAQKTRMLVVEIEQLVLSCFKW